MTSVTGAGRKAEACREGCKSCSFLADHFNATAIHLGHRDTSFAVLSCTPRSRMEGIFRSGIVASSEQNDVRWDPPCSSRCEQNPETAAAFHFGKTCRV